MRAHLFTVLAQAHMARLRQHRYPGRGIVLGLIEQGTHVVQVYWIMGRSAHSRNRVCKADHATGRLYTQAADPTLLDSPDLVIYNAMLERGPLFIVSNGDQTDTVARCDNPLNLLAALGGRTYEPDAPHFTPRLTATALRFKGGVLFQMLILRKRIFSEECERILYGCMPHPGFGHCIMTYAEQDNADQPLPSFRDDPLLVPLEGTMEEIAKTYWDTLSAEYRISLAVKSINIRSGHSEMYLINKYEEAPIQ